LFRLWDIPNRQLAIEQYREWKQQIPPLLIPAFSELTTAIENWQTEIFAYFDYRLTNAYTESLNSLVRSADRAGRGLSFKTLWAKRLFSAGLHRQYRPKYQKPGRGKPRQNEDESDLQSETSTDFLTPGAEISIFIEQLQLEGFLTRAT